MRTRAAAAAPATGALLAALLLLPPVASVLESRMSLHMLVQIPALSLAGALLAGALLAGQQRGRTGAGAPPRGLRTFDPGGVPGLLLAASIVTTWMVPRALDLAATHAGIDGFKAATLLLAGALTRWSWPAANQVTQAFVLGNMTWMAAVAGLLLRDAPMRLCTTYLERDQVHAGTGLLLLATAVGARWFLSLLGPARAETPSTA